MSPKVKPRLHLALSIIAFFLALVSATSATAQSCAVNVAAISFGNYDPLATVPNDSTTVVTLSCSVAVSGGSGRVNYTLSSSAGSGSFADRWLVSGTNRISYNLYVDPAISPATVWGDGAAGTRTITGSLGPLNRSKPSESVSFTIYARIPARQDVPVGFYSSSVIVTVDY